MKTVLHEIIEQGPDLAETTRKQYLHDVDAWIAFAGPDPSNWTRRTCEAFYTQLLTRMKPQSANRLMASIAYASRWWANREDNVDLDFVRLRHAKASDQILKSALTEQQATALLNSFVSSDPLSLRDRAVCVLGLETGMRRMSLISTSLDGLDGFLSGERIGYPAIPVLAKGMGKAKLNVPLSDTAIAAITPWRVWLSRNGVRRGPLFRACVKRIVNGQTMMIPTERGVSESSIQKMLAERSAPLGFHVHPHMFRHTFVTWRAAAGLTPIEIAAMTGHHLSGMGAMFGYVDMRAVAEKIRGSTPTWLRELIARST